jgi:hypothetical protein
MEACPLEGHVRRFRGARYSPPRLPTLQIGPHQNLLKAGCEISGEVLNTICTPNGALLPSPANFGQRAKQRPNHQETMTR